jgi:hypothetical protein
MASSAASRLAIPGLGKTWDLELDGFPAELKLEIFSCWSFGNTMNYCEHTMEIL